MDCHVVPPRNDRTYIFQGVDSGEPPMVGDGEMKKSYRNFILAANSRI